MSLGLFYAMILLTDKTEFGDADMKTLYLISGTMGVGKTTVSKQLNQILPNSAFLDGDWCWDASPFQVTEETKIMVIDNICYLLNNFLRCSAYENVIFCWVMHKQFIIDSILEKLYIENCNIKIVSLIADETNLSNRILSDVAKGIRSKNDIEKSVARIPMYQNLNTVKIDTNNKTIQEIANEIVML